MGTAALIPFVACWAILRGLSVPTMLGEMPLDVVLHLTTGERAAAARASPGETLAQNFPITLFGMALGFAFAFGLAISSRVARP